jgi:MFS family permease
MPVNGNLQIRKMSGIALIALFLVNFAYMADMAIIPAADAIYSVFSDAPIGLLNFILTGPQLIGVASALLISVLMRRFSKKRIIVVFFALFTISACLGAVVKDPYYIAAMRALVGFSNGGLAPAAIALISEVYFDDEKKLNGLVGAFSGFTALIGAAISIVAGWLCSIHWDYVYYIYFAAIPMLFLLMISLPDLPLQQATDKTNETTHVKMSISRLAALIGSILLICVIFNVMSYQCAIYVTQNGLGDSVFAGILSGVVTISTAVGCFIFAPIYNRLNRGISSVFYFMLALGFLTSLFPFNQVWAIVCFAILGFAYGLAMPYYYVRASAIVPPEMASSVTGIVAAAIGFGSFLSSFVSTFLINIFDFSALISLFPLYIGVLTLGGIVAVILAVRDKKTRLVHTT